VEFAGGDAWCDKNLLLVHAKQQTCGYEMATGKKLWQVEAVDGEIAPSPAWDGDVWLAANCYSKMVAFKLPPAGLLRSSGSGKTAICRTWPVP
jgi:hypothetical protein